MCVSCRDSCWNEVKYHPSYHGSISKQRAEEILNSVGDKDNCYITRFSETNSVYRLSVKKRKKISHLKIKAKVEGDHVVFQVKGIKRNSFNELLQLLEGEKIRLSESEGIGDCIESTQYKVRR